MVKKIFCILCKKKKICFYKKRFLIINIVFASSNDLFPSKKSVFEKSISPESKEKIQLSFDFVHRIEFFSAKKILQRSEKMIVRPFDYHRKVKRVYNGCSRSSQLSSPIFLNESSALICGRALSWWKRIPLRITS